MAVWWRSSVFGPVGCDQARWSTPSAVRASPTWSVLPPSGVVTRFQGAAFAEGAAHAAIVTARAAARILIGAVAIALRAADELDAVAVGIPYERDEGTLGAAARAVRRLLGLDAVLGELLQRPLQVVDQDGDVVVTRAQLVGVDPVVVGELQHR